MRQTRLVMTVLTILLLVPRIHADNQVYQKAAPSTVWFFEVGSASGVVIDVEKKLVLTAEHVVRASNRRGMKNVKVMFAQRDKDNHVLVDIEQYGFTKKKTLPIPGKIVYASRLQDIALIQLAYLPPHVTAVPLAKALPRPGDNIHVIGNSTFFRGGLFSYSTGCVRNSYLFKQPGAGNLFYSLAHHAPTNRGDSGGPVLNDNAELVGIVSQGTTGSGEGEQVIDQSVHLLELRKALKRSNWPIIKQVEFKGTAFITNHPHGVDWFFFPVQKNNKVALDLRGNGKTDLDLYAVDFDAEKAKQVKIAETGLTDQENGVLTPDWSGMAQVQVKNLFLQGQNVPSQTMTQRNTYALKIACPRPVQGPFCVTRSLAAQATDTLKLFFNANEYADARIEVRGDGDTELQLKIIDPNGQPVAGVKRIAGLPDRISIAFRVLMAGDYSIVVSNTDKQTYNTYVLRID